MKDLVLRYSRYATSAHNSQPFKFKFISDSEFEIYVDSTRALPVADPTQKDLQMGLGSLLESLRISLGQHGLNTRVNLEIKTLSGGLTLWAQVSVTSGGQKDREFSVEDLDHRFSYRGAYNSASNEAWKLLNKINESISVSPHAKFVMDEATQQQIAHLYDHHNAKALLSDGYIEELYGWLRFSSRASTWSQDGLNSQAMALSGIEALGGSLIMKPKIFRALGKVGLAETLVSEASKIKSSLGLWVIYAPMNQNFVENGKLFLREWLRMTQKNLFGAPLSLLTDDPAIQPQLKDLLHVPEGARIVNILKAGPLPPAYRRYQPARLENSQLVVSHV